MSIDMPCSAGRCAGSVTYPEQLLPYSPPASIEVTQVDVLDDADNRFATAGVFVQ